MLSYELAGEIFIKLDGIDPTLLPKLLRDAPEEKLNWVAFCKRVVQISDSPEEARGLLNNCNVFFGPLPKNYYIFPLKKHRSESIVVSIFLPSMISQWPIRVEYQLEDDEG